MHSRQYNIPARLSMEVDEEDVWAGIISTSSLAASADRRNPDSSISDNLNLSSCWLLFALASDQHKGRYLSSYLYGGYYSLNLVHYDNPAL